MKQWTVDRLDIITADCYVLLADKTLIFALGNKEIARYVKYNSFRELMPGEERPDLMQEAKQYIKDNP
jgi:hypothetical protein